MSSRAVEREITVKLGSRGLVSLRCRVWPRVRSRDPLSPPEYREFDLLSGEKDGERLTTTALDEIADAWGDAIAIAIDESEAEAHKADWQGEER